MPSLRDLWILLSALFCPPIDCLLAGERMLGGGDKGACGALVLADAVEALRKAVDHGYPASRPAFAEHYAMHVCRIVDGVVMQPGL